MQKSEDDKEVEPKKAKGPIDGSGDASDSGKTKQGKEKKSTKASSKSKNKRKRGELVGCFEICINGIHCRNMPAQACTHAHIVPSYTTILQF